MSEKKTLDAKKITMIGMFGAISGVLMLLEIPIPVFVPPFIKLDFSELPIILGGYMMGPVAGVFIIALKIIIKLLIKGTTTMGIGELSNAIGSLFYMLPAVLIYRHKKSKSGAGISLALGTLIVSVVLIFTNAFFVFPAFAKLFGMTMDAIVGMGAAVNPMVNNVVTLMLCAMFPFNLFKYGLVSVITFLVYKRLKQFLHM